MNIRYPLYEGVYRILTTEVSPLLLYSQSKEKIITPIFSFFAASQFYGSSFYRNFCHRHFILASQLSVCLMRIVPQRYLSCLSCIQGRSLTVPDKISTLRFAEVVFGRETLHKEP